MGGGDKEIRGYKVQTQLESIGGVVKQMNKVKEENNDEKKLILCRSAWEVEMRK